MQSVGQSVAKVCLAAAVGEACPQFDIELARKPRERGWAKQVDLALVEKMILDRMHGWAGLVRVLALHHETIAISMIGVGWQYSDRIDCTGDEAELEPSVDAICARALAQLRASNKPA